ncbi:uncharacterized protein LOC120279614 [Dioscorea cayenensis subsp. rotundata]|uniref:Uncharacterized protein LOC120279614 n=1 Tax=Dioscorea cayennensis subsp. rotundata TaxID=55577 RepID=A0AB40CV61_DIOCR|nr:uncharacterized protein LOC120279614 [Dioscorea cayenensis subsp. rotundata]
MVFEACKDVASIASSSWDFSCDFEVDNGSEEHATIIREALAVDQELQPDKVRRHMSVSDGKLIVRFEAVEARFFLENALSYLLFEWVPLELRSNLGQFQTMSTFY